MKPPAPPINRQYNPEFHSNIPSNIRYWHAANKRNEPIDHLTDEDLYNLFAEHYADDMDGKDDYEYWMEMITELYSP